MKDKYRVSFCIRIYNNRDDALQMIEELLSSNNSNIQIVLSDDCSTDGTIGAIEKIQDKRIKLIVNFSPFVKGEII